METRQPSPSERDRFKCWAAAERRTFSNAESIRAWMLLPPGLQRDASAAALDLLPAAVKGLPLGTTADDVIKRFAVRSRAARSELDNWLNDRRYRDVVVPRVLAHRTSAVDQLEIADVSALANWIKLDKANRHPLADISKETDVDPAAEISEYWATFAMMQVLHFVVEDLGKLPTYEEFRRHPIAGKLLWEEGWQARQRSMRIDGVSPEVAGKALRWRVGNAYYSLIREQMTFAILRSLGLEVRQHILADVLFRTDCWIGEINLDVFVFNARYRGPGRIGRKKPAEDRYRDAQPPFLTLEMGMPVQHAYGEAHLPDIDKTVQLGLRIKKYLDTAEEDFDY